jgi:RNA 2',3'-cyclic 3'-phosphodiesterase
LASRAPSSARLFVALELPAEAREQVVEWQREALGAHRDALRLVAPAALHVTLAFLGHHPEAAVDEIAAAALSRLDGPAPPSLEFAAVAPVPPRRPRLLALDLADPDGRAAAVQAAVEAPLVAGGWYEPEKRPFWPHLTVARVRSGARPPRDLEADPPAGSFVADEVVLYRSKLGRGGAQYTPLARMTLR